MPSGLETDMSLCQGILGVYMREPLLDWQKEGRLLKDARRDGTQAADTAEDLHIAAKVSTPCCCITCQVNRGSACCAGCNSRLASDSARTKDHCNGGCTMLQVQTAREKLQGRHPSDVLLAELAPKYSSTAHWAALQVRMIPNSLLSRSAIAASTHPRSSCCSA